MKQLLVFLVLLAFWFILSGHFDLFHISAGIICSALVAHFSSDLLRRQDISQDRLHLGRLLQYLPWLFYQIILANFHVAYLVLRPQKIHPQIVRLRTSLTSDVAITVLGNSITLTPGTITMDIDRDELIVHALSDKVANDLLAGHLERRVAHVFAVSGGNPS